MIVWLASYPRSGNTLLRTVLKQTMDLGSYSDEVMLPTVKHTETAKQEYGNLTYESSWESFYQQASASKETFLVKTHLPPRDNQPVIYVVRDGRAATESYASYHASFINNHQHSSSIMSLMLGDDYYGDWSTHFEKWNSREEGKLLLVRFEELVNADIGLLQKLKAFVGFEMKTIPFKNPINKLQLENPNFFRSGKTTWKVSVEWTETEVSLFIVLHSNLLISLGYIDVTERENALRKLEPKIVNLAELAKKGFSEKSLWLNEAKLKESVIQKLLDEKRSSKIKSIFNKNGLADILGLKRQS
jgi:hypothetical protein